MSAFKMEGQTLLVKMSPSQKEELQNKFLEYVTNTPTRHTIREMIIEIYQNWVEENAEARTVLFQKIECLAFKHLWEEVRKHRSITEEFTAEEEYLEKLYTFIETEAEIYSA